LGHQGRNRWPRELHSQSSSPALTASGKGAWRGPGKKEGIAVKLVLILHSSAVDLVHHPARVKKRARINGQALASFQYFGRGLTSRGALTPLGVNAEVVFDAVESFFQRL
jgi:hypothetical protein